MLEETFIVNDVAFDSEGHLRQKFPEVLYGVKEGWINRIVGCRLVGNTKV